MPSKFHPWVDEVSPRYYVCTENVMWISRTSIIIWDHTILELLWRMV
jgi:hypothetical protein